MGCCRVMMMISRFLFWKWATGRGISAFFGWMRLASAGGSDRLVTILKEMNAIYDGGFDAIVGVQVLPLVIVITIETFARYKILSLRPISQTNRCIVL